MFKVDETIFSCDLSNPIMERVPRTGASVYHQSPPPPDLLPVMASAPAEPVPAAGLPTVVASLLRPHVPTVHTAHMAFFVQTMCNPAQVAQLRATSMDAQTMVQQRGGGQSIQQQGGRQTAQLAGSNEPAAGAVDNTQQEGQKKAKVQNSSHQCHNSSADQGSARACSARWLSVCCWFHFPAHSVIRA